MFDLKMLPENISRKIVGKTWICDDIGMSDSTILLFDEIVLKIEKTSRSAKNETILLGWLNGKLPVPKIIVAEEHDSYSFLLMSKLSGEMSCSDANLKNIESTAIALAKGLKMLWGVDVANCPLHWFEPDAFRAECKRIGKPGALVIAIYNNTPGGSSMTHSKCSTDVFFTNPTAREFPNPIFYTRESWVAYMTSHSNDPLPTDSHYAAHIDEVNAIFDRENADGLLRRDVVTKVYSEKVGV